MDFDFAGLSGIGSRMTLAQTPCYCRRLAATLACLAAGCIAPDRTAGQRPTIAAASPGAAHIEAETMKRSGGNSLSRAGMVGAILYENKDSLKTYLSFGKAGRWRIDVRGASSDKHPAGVTVFVDGQARASGWFLSRTPQVLPLVVDVDTAGMHEVRLGQTTDVGENDAYIDWIEVQWEGAAMKAPTPPATGAVASGHWRNLFAERGYPEAEVSRKIEEAWQSLFHGDPDQEAVYFEKTHNADGPLAYVMDIGNGDVRSEGMSYGMMIAVQLNHKHEFDALWNWAHTFMAHPDPQDPVHGYFSWQMHPDGKIMDPMPAPDGEEYFVTALYFADARWGSGKGIYDYHAEADQLLRAMRSRAVIGTVTSVFNREHKEVRFTPNMQDFASNGDHTDPSYHQPAFYEVWARVGPPSEAAFWREAAKTSRDFLERAANPKTGLVPDYAEFDGRPKPRKNDPGGGDFRYDAWRAAMNWSVDEAWWAGDPRARDRSDRLQAFFEQQGLWTYVNRYHLDGRPIGKDRSPGLSATNAVASLAATNARAWRFVDELWSLRVPHGLWRYYDGMLYLMGLLHASGEFRPYFPRQ
jgi:oligosaccharide reducing-end xylanase